MPNEILDIDTHMEGNGYTHLPLFLILEPQMLIGSVLRKAEVRTVESLSLLFSFLGSYGRALGETGLKLLLASLWGGDHGRKGTGAVYPEYNI